ncbi:hypothetical protein TWF696_001569 [Orbilia brochopaga]|uniref:Uncharacterized protein n=1 Tax=Orbilia brochopaga TaxID=3140254 RepID=A0AAV9U9U8_9PEZI
MIIPMAICVTIFEKHGADWSCRTSDLERFLTDCYDSPEPSFVFADSAALYRHNDPGCAGLRKELQKFYGMPSRVWNNVHQDSSGFFGCRDGESGSYKSWFRFFVKQLYKDQRRSDSVPEFYTYYWHRLGFFTTWSPSGRKSILCLDCPLDVVEDVKASLYETEGRPFQADPFWFHHIIVGALLGFYNNSIWTMREAALRLEKKRPQIRRPTPDYYEYHELMNHVIHSKETLLVSSEIVSKIIQRQREWHTRNFETKPAGSYDESLRRYSMQVYDDLNCYHMMLYGLKCRQESLEGRHRNNIASTSLIVAQYHGSTAVGDSRAMKVIAGLTVAFLPATFVSAVFSMGFFEADESNLSVSKSFWIYWAFAVPLTVVTAAVLGLIIYKQR